MKVPSSIPAAACSYYSENSIVTIGAPEIPRSDENEVLGEMLIRRSGYPPKNTGVYIDSVKKRARLILPAFIQKAVPKNFYG